MAGKPEAPLARKLPHTLLAEQYAPATLLSALDAQKQVALVAPQWTTRVRMWMRRLDHSAIFVLIAGSGTPICLLGISGDTWGTRANEIVTADAVKLIDAYFNPKGQQYELQQLTGTGPNSLSSLLST
jgi:hypothetical protein